MNIPVIILNTLTQVTMHSIGSNDASAKVNEVNYRHVFKNENLENHLCHLQDFSY